MLNGCRRYDEVGDFMPLMETGCEKDGKFALLLGLPFAAAVALAVFRIGAWTVFRVGPGAHDAGIPFFAHAVQALVMVFLVLFDRRISYTRKTLFRILALVALLGVVASVLVMVPLVPTAYVGSTLHGAVSAFIMMGVGFVFCSLPPARSAVGLAMAFALYGVCTWVLVFVPPVVNAAIAVVCFPVALLCLFVGFGKEEGIMERDESGSAKKSEFPWEIFAILLICTIASMVARVVAPDTGGALSLYGICWPIIMIAICLLYGVWVVVLEKERVDGFWIVFVLIIFSGLLCWSSFSNVAPDFAASFFRATRECLMLFCWVVVAEVAYSRNMPRVSFFGVATLILLSMPAVVLSAMGWLAPEWGSVLPRTEALFVTTAVSFLLVVATLVLVSRRSRRIVAGSEAGKIGSDEFVVDMLAERYDLTNREKEVVALLSKGHTLPSIAESLCISLDTVRSHSKSIYRKLCVHKKQSLIALIDEIKDECR